jgi:predicted enzyme related to lactoylglutathione lyase
MKKNLLTALLIGNLLVTGTLLCSYTFGKKNETVTGRVTGIGGIFFKTKDVKATNKWYYDNLGLAPNDYGCMFEWRESDSKNIAYTQWSPFSARTKYFQPSKKDFMINYRVDNMEMLLKKLKAGNVTICDTVESDGYGKFVHIMDCDSNKVELWEPADPAKAKPFEGKTTK